MSRTFLILIFYLVFVSQALATGLGNNQQQFINIYKRIDKLQKKEVKEFYLSDKIARSLYTLFLLSEFGDFELSQNELQSIVKRIFLKEEKLFLLKIKEKIKEIKKLKFTNKKGVTNISLETIGGDSIIIDMNEKLAAPDNSTGLKINKLIIQNGANIVLKNIDDVNLIIKEIRKENKYKHVPLAWYQQINKIDDSLQKNIRLHLSLGPEEVPLKVLIEGVNISITPPTILKETNVSLRSGYIIPAMTDGETRYPSTIFSGNSKLINFKISIDQ